MIEKYEKYLEKIDGYLNKFFVHQKPYIFCKKGCAFCCETGEYPFSEVEFEYLKLGYYSLAEREKTILDSKVKEIKKEKEAAANNPNGEKFLHECPFLIDKKCSVYKHRGLICRSYGLMSFIADKEGKMAYKRPLCSDMGLNYSNVVDEKTGAISSEKWRALKIETEPLGFNIGLDFLTNNNMTQELNLELGAQKALIDWF